MTATVAKLLARDLFGVEKVLPWGMRIYSALVSDYNEKSAAIAAIGDFAQAMGVRRKYREQIDQCIDEMLMNALYDAPVDDDGKPLFADVPVRERVLMRADEKALVQYGCDGERFAVSVRDAFGTLRKDDDPAVPRQVPARIGTEQIDRKAGGAGLGLYLICNSASEVGFHIFAGSATEVICSFDLSAQRAQLRALGDLRGAHPRRAARRARRDHDHPDAPRPPPRRSGAASAAAARRRALAGDDDLRRAAARSSPSAWPRCPTCAVPPPPSLHIETDPPGALVYVDGRSRGSRAARRRRPRPAAATPCARSVPAIATTSSWSPPPPATRRCACTSIACRPRSPSRPSPPAPASSSTARRPAS